MTTCENLYFTYFRFYAIATTFDKFSNEGKNLVVQFTIKHEQNIDCGGGYIKLFPSDLKPKDMHGESKYNIMFGKKILSPLKIFLLFVANLGCLVGFGC